MTNESKIGVVFGVLFVIMFIFAPFEGWSIILHEIILFLFIVIVIISIYSVILSRQIIKISKNNYIGDKEDEMDAIVYRKFSDYSLFGNIALVLSLISLSISIIIKESLVIVIISVLLVIISYIINMGILYLIKHVYPERNLPSPTEKNYAEKLLESSDDGEKHIILNGLHKSFGVINILLVFAIIFATIYTIQTDNSQVFSIIMIGIIMIWQNITYYLTIRNK